MEVIIDCMVKIGIASIFMVGVFVTGVLSWSCLAGLKILFEKITKALEVDSFDG